MLHTTLICMAICGLAAGVRVLGGDESTLPEALRVERRETKHDRSLGPRDNIPLQYLFATGDSYTTVGFNSSGTLPNHSNRFGNPAYPGAVFTGGPNYIDLLVYNYLPNYTYAYDFAVGGRTVNMTLILNQSSRTAGQNHDMIDQLADLEALKVRLGGYLGITNQNSLSLSWFGINDIVLSAGLYFSAPTYTDAQLPGVWSADIDQYFKQLDRLYNLGVRSFVSVLVPPLARTAAYANNMDAGTNRVRSLVSMWNQMMTSKFNAWAPTKSGARAALFDPTPTFNYVLDNYAQFGAPNDTCYSYPSGTPCLWTDFVHPGVQISKVLGKAVYDFMHNNSFI